MNIGIVRNKSKKEGAFYEKKMSDAIEQNGGSVVIIDRDTLNSFKPESIDMVVSMGGDGTFLKTASMTVENDIPVLGFNLGTLGLLTEFEKDDIEEIVRRLCHGEYEIEKRNVIDVYIAKQDGTERLLGRALNDCVMQRGALSGVVYINLFINGVFVDNYPCDGFIVATQTGSTAYSLSAGGPIVEPGNNVNVITPICSHSLLSRPVVSKPSSNIRLELCKKHKNIHVVLDGHIADILQEDEFVECRESRKRLQIVRLNPPNFYTALHAKFLKRSDKFSLPD